MPAECEIDDCGVLAIGRCRQCGKAMCTSHRASNSYGPIVDTCGPCQGEAWAEIERTQQAKIDRVAAAQSTVKKLASRLTAAGVTPDREYGYSSKIRYFLGRQREQRTPLYGWYVGEHLWRLADNRPGSDGGSVRERRPTFVTANGEVVQDSGYVDASRHHGLGMDGIDTQLAAWEEVARALAELARQYAVT